MSKRMGCYGKVRGLELGSLHRWAKKDSPEEYKNYSKTLII